MDYIINFGGFDATKTYRSYDTIDVFKVTANGVEKVDDHGLALSEPRHDTASATLGDFTVVMGGTSGFDVTDAIDIFKTTKNGVIKVENHGLKLSVARTDLAAAAAGSYILAMGGDSGSYSDVVDVFKVTENGVLGVGSHGLALSEARGVFTAASAGNFILAMGGMIKSDAYSDAVDVFKVTSDGVEHVDYGLSLSEPRAFLSSAAIGNYILAIGGSAGSSLHYKSVDVFEVKNDEVIKLNNHGLKLSVARNVLATAVVGDYVLAMGGFDGTNALDTVDVFKLENGNFERVTNHGLALNPARAYLSAASAGNYILAMGGIVARDENKKSIPTNAIDVFYNYD